MFIDEIAFENVVCWSCGHLVLASMCQRLTHVIVCVTTFHGSNLSIKEHITLYVENFTLDKWHINNAIIFAMKSRRPSATIALPHRHIVTGMLVDKAKRSTVNEDVPEVGIKDRDKKLHVTGTVGCNYLSLPLMPASNAQVLQCPGSGPKQTSPSIRCAHWRQITHLLIDDP